MMNPDNVPGFLLPFPYVIIQFMDINNSQEVYDFYDEILKAKYIKRTGTPGNYKYEYTSDPSNMPQKQKEELYSIFNLAKDPSKFEKIVKNMSDDQLRNIIVSRGKKIREREKDSAIKMGNGSFSNT